MFDRPHCIGIALLAALATAAPQSAPAQSFQIARYVGTYESIQPGTDTSLKLTLVLAPHGIATMRGEFSGPAKISTGTPIYPSTEDGTWAVGGPNVLVHLTRTTRVIHGRPVPVGKEDVTLAFSLSRCTLKLARDPGNVFGKDGLKLKKRDC